MLDKNLRYFALSQYPSLALFSLSLSPFTKEAVKVQQCRKLFACHMPLSTPDLHAEFLFDSLRQLRDEAATSNGNATLWQRLIGALSLPPSSSSFQGQQWRMLIMRMAKEKKAHRPGQHPNDP